MVRQIPSKPPYSINSTLVEKIYLNDINSMIIYKFNKGNAKFILGVLNSRLISFWFNMKFNKLQRGLFPQFKVKELETFPIRPPFPSQEKKIISLVNQMLELQKKYHDEKTIGNEKERLKSQIDAVDYEIDEEVYKLYELTPEEIKIVDDSLK